MGKSKQQVVVEFALNKKEKKKVDKLEAQIPYYDARKEQDEVNKLRGKIDKIWDKARAERAFDAMVKTKALKL
eukprot:CAMPEP_0194137226 /NCGR_PEP_ID=MMETSP0152-20130528/7154_1 /TAXON_ID=1049557 /ORGANISM="Thalassiothrix antarctica, Strain L6-D1" /LENGTH=72 /DNA_ID=CAMNT_0038834171 /DNA_START=82 /DNA_END=298 /DNA_ORIENTATION=-